jgi:serine/threonine-protein kinase
MALTAGQRLGVYEVIGPIGAGGMGEVYRARDTRLNRDVALKILPTVFAADPDRLARFEREAQLLAALNNPHIAGIHGLEESSGVRAIVMELVDGETLAERIAGASLPMDESLAIARQIADALEAAHDQGIIHRDLKPANIKISSSGSVKVLDFGLAKLNDPNPSSVSNVPNATMSPTIVSPAMTTVGVLLGTAAYMAPEQARGRATDRRVDVWAFGCVLFEMLSGTQAFPGSDVTEVLATVLKSDPEWSALPASTPPRIRRVLERCLQKDPRQRLRDIGDVRLVLDGAFETAPATPVTVPVRGGRPNVLWPIAIVVAVLAGAGLTRYVGRPVIEPDAVGRFSLVLPAGDQLPYATGTMVGVSRDGTTLVYRAARGGTLRLFVRRLDQLEATIVGDPSPGEAPFFSYDGQWIAYLGNNALKKVPVTGGPAETITMVTDPFRGGDWGEDGNVVLAGSTLWMVPSTGGVVTTFATAPAGRRFWFPQRISGGRAILYTVSAQRPDAGDIEVLDIASKTSRKLVQGVAGRVLPTGHLVFLRNGSLWAVRFDESTLQVQGTPVPVQEAVRVEGGGAVQFAVAGDGTLMYIPGTQSGASQLVWIDRTGKEEVLNVPPRPYFSLRLDPTSTQVALEVRDPGAEGADIWVLPLGRQTPRRVTFDPADDALPSWTPDGRLVYTSTRGNAASVFLQAADGTGAAEKIATDPLSLDQVAVTPDGKYLVARSNEDIMLIARDGKSAPRKLIEGPFRDRNPEVSRDGKWIAYQSDESGRPEVYVRAFPDTGRGKWQVSEQGGSRPLWAHSGKELLYMSATGDLTSVMFRAEGDAFVASTPTRLMALPPTPGAARAYDVSADDKRFLVSRTEASTERAEINLVLNWLEELKKKVPTK